MDAIKVLFTATATVTGGRNGHATSNDETIDVDLSLPKVMGGQEKPHTTIQGLK